MNILVCGEYSSLCRQILRRLGKEKAELYYLTGSERSVDVDVPLFQIYRFSYLNENVVRTLTSSKADVVILLGALDLNFVWGKGELTAADYTSSMLRVLTAAKNANAKKVIYISSTEIFELNEEEQVTRETNPLCNSLRTKTLKSMEQLCRNFADESMQVDIVRLPQTFGDYESNQENNICLTMALDYIRNGKMTCFPTQKHSAMFNSDATEIICKFVSNYKPQEVLDSEALLNTAGKDEKPADNAAPEPDDAPESCTLSQFKGYVFTEKELCETLLDTGWRKDAMMSRDYSGVNDIRSIFPPEHLTDTQEEELRFSIRFTFKEAIDSLCQSLLRYRKEEEKAKKESIKILPIIETMLCACLAFVLSYFTKDMWIGENFNFFAVFVALIAAVYGTAHGLFASFLGSIGTLVLMVMDSTITEVLGGLEFFMRFLLLVVIGVAAGFMRDKFFRRNSNLTEENQYLTAELADITRINDSNLYVKNVYEKRLIEYRNSLARIYELTSQLDFLATQKVIFQANRVVQEMMNTPHVAIYVTSQNSYFFRLAAVGTDKAGACGKSIQLNENSFLYKTLMNQEIYMNRDLSPERPTFAGAIYEHDRPIAIVMVWAESIEHVNLYESNMLAVLCRLIGGAFGRAISYEGALRERTYIEGTSIIRQDSFKEIVDIAEDGMRQGLMTYTLLRLDLKGSDVSAAGNLVRDTDYIGVIDGTVYVCLTNSNEAEAGFVMNRIRKKGFSSDVVSYEYLCEVYEAVDAS